MSESLIFDYKKKGKQKTILIFGISSFVGSNLAAFFKNDYKVIGTYHKSPIFLNGVVTVPCDVLNREQIQLVVFAFKPDIVIYCAGVSSILDCSMRESAADSLNTNGLLNVTEACERNKAQVCYISSSHVFGGENKKYTEIDIPNSLTFYGRTQAQSEFYVQKNSLNYIIFRTCPLYGRSYNRNFVTWYEKLEYKVALGKKLIADNFVHTGFLDIYYLALLMRMSFEREYNNRLFQVCSSNIMTHYQFAKLYCKQFSMSDDSVSPGKWAYPKSKLADLDLLEDNLYFDMDTSNVESFLRIKLPSIEESLKLTFKRFKGVIKASAQTDSSSSTSVKYI